MGRHSLIAMLFLALFIRTMSSGGKEEWGDWNKKRWDGNWNGYWKDWGSNRSSAPAKAAATTNRHTTNEASTKQRGNAKHQSVNQPNITAATTAVSNTSSASSSIKPSTRTTAPWGAANNSAASSTTAPSPKAPALSASSASRWQQRDESSQVPPEPTFQSIVIQYLPLIYSALNEQIRGQEHIAEQLQITNTRIGWQCKEMD